MASMGSALLASALLVILVSLGRTHADDDPHPSGPSVRTAAGRILGRWVEAERGGARFGAFLGIPYAEPPVGQLRYKTTQPIKRSIDDTIQATEDAPVCPQLNTRNGETEVIGQEDCLYLNVYAVMAKPSPLLPVIFLVHGGRFDHGSGRMDAIGPHFLLTGGDVLVVTVNFRQGPLGFLSLDTDDVPGNAGLKDLVVALEWVKQNIIFFGGDASRITAMGVSTGASAVHLLSLIPQARGLFARAFLMGGHAISPRAYTERHVERAVALAHILGSDNNGTDAVTRTLRGASAEKILMACNDPRAIDLGYPTGLFLPSPERRAAGTAKLLEHDPESMLRQPRVAPMPTVFGMNEREGSYARNSWDLESKSPAELDEMLPRLVPTDILPGADTRAQLGLQPGAGPGGPLNPRLSLRLAQQVRSEYGADMTNNTDIFVEFLGDSFIGASALRVADFMARFSTPAAPFFLYKFLVDDDYNYVKKLRNISLPGSTHTDDLGYVARSDKSPDLNQDASAAGVAPEILRRWSRAVVDFAKGLEPVRGWTPVHPGPLGRSAPALHIGPKVRFEMNRDIPRRLRFWDSVYSCLRRPQSRPTTARGL